MESKAKALLLVLFYLCMFTGTLSIGGRRTHLYQYTPAQRTVLAGLINSFITTNPAGYSPDVTTYHFLAGQHGNNQFLPWHRIFLQAVENHLIASGYSNFVPLPKWDPQTPIPPEFLGSGSYGSPLPFNSYPYLAGTYDFSPYKIKTSLCAQQFDLFSANLECLHDIVHGSVGSIMGSLATAANAHLFYPWHAFIDDIYWDYQCECQGLFGRPDLYIRDSATDGGTQPSINIPNPWHSPDIWWRTVRDTKDPVTLQYSHENDPDATRSESPTPGTAAWVYVKIRNKGCKSISDAILYISFSYENVGSVITIVSLSPIALPSIGAGQTYVAEAIWTIPDTHHYCTRAKIESPTDPFVPNSDYVFELVNNNNKAQRNVNLVRFSVYNPSVLEQVQIGLLTGTLHAIVPVTFPKVFDAFVTVPQGAPFQPSTALTFDGRSYKLGSPDANGVIVLGTSNTNVRNSYNFGLEFKIRDGCLQNVVEPTYYSNFTVNLPQSGTTGYTYQLNLENPCTSVYAGPNVTCDQGCITIGKTIKPCTDCTYRWYDSKKILVATTPTYQACPTSTQTYSLTVSHRYGCSVTTSTTVYYLENVSADAGPDQYINLPNCHSNCVYIGNPNIYCRDCTYSWEPQYEIQDPRAKYTRVCPKQTTTYTLTVRGLRTNGYSVDSAVVYVQNYGNIIYATQNYAYVDNTNPCVNITRYVTYYPPGNRCNTWTPKNYVRDYSGSSYVVCPPTGTYTTYYNGVYDFHRGISQNVSITVQWR